MSDFHCFWQGCKLPVKLFLWSALCLVAHGVKSPSAPVDGCGVERGTARMLPVDVNTAGHRGLFVGWNRITREEQASFKNNLVHMYVKITLPPRGWGEKKKICRSQFCLMFQGIFSKRALFPLMVHEGNITAEKYWRGYSNCCVFHFVSTSSMKEKQTFPEAHHECSRKGKCNFFLSFVYNAWFSYNTYCCELFSVYGKLL